ncbi:MAG: hypothetical protein IT256_09525 [Chitinophagaceae bacterium]|nr:hypothetical protein [Chitinophagaceae bacterium]
MTTTFRKLALGAFLTVSALSTVTMTSCNKEETLVCDTGYEGSDCKTEVRAKYIKTWNAEDVTPSGSKLLYSCPIASSTGSVTSVIISKSFGDGIFDNNINATISGTTITISPQTPDNDGFTVEGTGTLANGKIQWTYTITPPISLGSPLTNTGVWN